MKTPLILAFLLFMIACSKTETPLPVLTTSSTSLTMGGSSNSSDTLTVNFAGSWTASIQPATATWLSLSKTSGTGTSKIAVTILQTNTSSSVRSATLVLKPDNGTPSQSVTVTQQPFQPSKFLMALGGAEDDELNASVPTTDGGHISVGYSSSNNGDVSGAKGGKDAWVIRYDTEGKMVWQKLFGGPGDEIANAIVAAPDGFIIVGITNSTSGDFSPSKGDFDVFALKIDISGNIIWSKTFGGSLYESGFSIIATTDGNFLIAASTNSINGDVVGNHVNPTTSFSDAWVIKINGSGDAIWKKCFGSKFYEGAIAAANSPDGGYVTVGYTDASQADGDIPRFTPTLSIVMHKMDGSGNLQWTKIFGGSDLEFAFDVKPANDGGYLIGGYTLSNDGDVTGYKGGYDGWLIKTADNGDIIWNRTYGTAKNEVINSIVNLSNGYKLAGEASPGVTSAGNPTDGWMFSASNSGVMSNEKRYGGSKPDGFRHITNLNNGFFLLTGITQSADSSITGSKGKVDGFLVKTND